MSNDIEVEPISTERFDQLAVVAQLSDEQRKFCKSLLVNAETPGVLEVELKYYIFGKEIKDDQQN